MSAIIDMNPRKSAAAGTRLCGRVPAVPAPRQMAAAAGNNDARLPATRAVVSAGCFAKTACYHPIASPSPSPLLPILRSGDGGNKGQSSFLLLDGKRAGHLGGMNVALELVRAWFADR